MQGSFSEDVRVSAHDEPPSSKAQLRTGHFIYPAGWNSETIDLGIHDLGVNLIRLDSQAVWREQSQTSGGVPLASELRDFEINQLLEFLALQDTPLKELCANDGTSQVGGGIITAFSSIMFRVGGNTALIATSVSHSRDCRLRACESRW